MSKIDEDEVKHFEELYYVYLEEYFTEIGNVKKKWSEEASAVKTQTEKENENTIMSCIQMIIFQSHVFSVYLDINASTVSEIFEDVEEAIKSSFFLALNGWYTPAKSQLRKWFEIMLIAIKFDSELLANLGNQRQTGIHQKIEKWLEGKHTETVTGNGVISYLVDTNTNSLGSQIWNQKNDFSTELLSMYTHLSSFVHLGKIKEIDELVMGFTEYDEKRFKEWFVLFCKVNESILILSSMKYSNFFKKFESEIKKNQFTGDLLILNQKIIANLKQHYS